MKSEHYEALKQAIKASECNSQDLLQIYKELRLERDLVLADSLIKWISNNWKEELISILEIVDNNICNLGSRATVKRLFYMLEDQGYMQKQPRYVYENGKMKNYWKILKKKENE